MKTKLLALTVIILFTVVLQVNAQDIDLVSQGQITIDDFQDLDDNFQVGARSPQPGQTCFTVKRKDGLATAALACEPSWTITDFVVDLNHFPWGEGLVGYNASIVREIDFDSEGLQEIAEAIFGDSVESESRFGRLVSGVLSSAESLVEGLLQFTDAREMHCLILVPVPEEGQTLPPGAGAAIDCAVVPLIQP